MPSQESRERKTLTAAETSTRDYDRALDLLEDFCERFYWIKDHPDYQDEVRKFLESKGRSPRPYGN